MIDVKERKDERGVYLEVTLGDEEHQIFAELAKQHNHTIEEEMLEVLKRRLGFYDEDVSEKSD